MKGVFIMADLNSIVLELFGRVQALERKVAELEKRGGQPTVDTVTEQARPLFPNDKVSERYKELAIYLYEKWEKKIELTYQQIEEILGFSLPATAYNLPQSYWANTETHSYAKGSWLAIGYRAKIVGDKKILFERNIY